VLRLEWSDEYASGNAVIDAGHRQLFTLANRLIDASLRQCSSPKEIKNALVLLMGDVQRHFADEEAILERMNYIGIVQHRRAHGALLTVFVVSWKNPGASLAGASFADYLMRGVREAIEVAREICEVPSVHAVGYCLGGTALAALMAWLNAGRSGHAPVANGAATGAAMCAAKQPMRGARVSNRCRAPGGTTGPHGWTSGVVRACRRGRRARRRTPAWKPLGTYVHEIQPSRRHAPVPGKFGHGAPKLPPGRFRAITRIWSVIIFLRRILHVPGIDTPGVRCSPSSAHDARMLAFRDMDWAKASRSSARSVRVCAPGIDCDGIRGTVREILHGGRYRRSRDSHVAVLER
jgi:hemerythrin-like metal-binding protein